MPLSHFSGRANGRLEILQQGHSQFSMRDMPIFPVVSLLAAVWNITASIPEAGDVGGSGH